MSKLARNDPCHCGSGKKYKLCHLDADLAEARRATPGAPSPAADEPEGFGTAWVAPTLVGVALLVGVSLWRGVGQGILVAAAWGIGITAWMIFRDPPPPNERPGDPAALNFGRPSENRSSDTRNNKR